VLQSLSIISTCTRLFAVRDIYLSKYIWVLLVAALKPMMQGTSRTGTPFPFFIIQRERPPCEITYQLAVGTQNCFSTLFYTPYTNIKTSAQNAPLPDKKSKNFLGGIPLPRPHPSLAPRCARRSRSFSFTTRTLQWCYDIYSVSRVGLCHKHDSDEAKMAYISKLTEYEHMQCMATTETSAENIG